MMKMVLSLIVCAVSGALFTGYLVRFLYYARKRRKFCHADRSDALYARLKEEYREARIPVFRNYLLYLIVHTAYRRGEREYAARLAPFLKRDRFCDFFDPDQ